jgi:hypothetical protein
MEQLSYELCPYERLHVLEIYRGLASCVIDGRWREKPGKYLGRCVYRVSRDMFQVLYSRRPGTLFEALMDVEPPVTEDDGDWTILRRSRKEAPLLTSPFCTIPAVSGFELLDHALLERFGFFFDQIKGTKSETAYAVLQSLEPAAVLDAMTRLKYLEQWVLETNRKLTRNVLACAEELIEELRDASESRVVSLETFITPPSHGRIAPRRRSAFSELENELSGGGS